MNVEKDDINKRENKGEIFFRKWLEFSPMIIYVSCLLFLVLFYNFDPGDNYISFKEITGLFGELSFFILFLVGSRIFLFFLMAFFCKLNFILFMKNLFLESLFYYLTFFIIGIIVAFLSLKTDNYAASVAMFIFIYIYIYMNINIIKNYKFIKKRDVSSLD
jgi:hypothetical protein